ncbi:MAG: carboxylate--amine ligase [Raoultibacter sp.]|jgi:hypothetical protein
MTKNADYTQEYLDIINALDGDIPSRRATQSYMRNSTAIVHHEVVKSSFVPRLYNEKTYKTMEAVSEKAHAILEKVMQRYLDDSEYRSVFNLDPRLVDLILLPRGYDALLPFARVDIFLNEDDYSAKFCEFNADGSSGMNEDREIVNSIVRSQAFAEFSKTNQLKPSELFTSWVEEFLSIYKSYAHAVENPQVAICDFLENAVVAEFEIFCKIFADYGVECAICDVRDLRFDGEQLCNKSGGRIDAIWRRSVTNDIIDHWEESQNLIEAVRAEKVALIGSFAGHLVHDKQIFQVLFMEQTRAFLTDDEIKFIEDTIPYTCFLDTSEIDLQQVKDTKDRWIIKPTDHYGADHVYAGRAKTNQEWTELIDRFANSKAGFPFIVQEYCIPFQTKTLVPDIGIEEKSDLEVSTEPLLYNNLSGLYLYNGRFMGVFSRLGPCPTISKDMQGITSATIWVD